MPAVVIIVAIAVGALFAWAIAQQHHADKQRKDRHIPDPFPDDEMKPGA
jgi:predicted negative regulator of RcsB-dependent stress response